MLARAWWRFPVGTLIGVALATYFAGAGSRRPAAERLDVRLVEVPGDDHSEDVTDEGIGRATPEAPHPVQLFRSWWAVGVGALLLFDLAVYYAVAERLPDISVWWEVLVLSLGLFPATFALVGLALPLRGSRLVLPAIVLLGGLAAAAEVVDRDILANFAKLAAVTGAGWLFLRFFERATWVALVALLIVPIDIFSVARGPTKQIVEEQPQVFDHLSVAFPIPGEQTSAQLGLPDVLFFALFLGAADRFGLRTGLTWLLASLSFGGTVSIAVFFDLGGVPALPLLSAAFVLANADRLWRSFKDRKRA